MRGETLSEEVTREVRPGERARPLKEERAKRVMEAQPGLSERVRERVVDELPRPLRVPQRPATVEPPKLPTGNGRHVVILVENLPVPFDRRPWQIAQTLLKQDYRVSVICPQMYEYTKKHEQL